jgi:hypothetical protein
MCSTWSLIAMISGPLAFTRTQLWVQALARDQ